MVHVGRMTAALEMSIPICMRIGNLLFAYWLISVSRNRDSSRSSSGASVLSRTASKCPRASEARSKRRSVSADTLRRLDRASDARGHFEAVRDNTEAPDELRELSRFLLTEISQ